MQPKFAIIFDMDGVLADTMPLIHESFEELLRNENIHLSSDQIKMHLTRPLREIHAVWKQEHGLKLTMQEFSEKAAEIEITKLAQKAQIDSGLLAFLNEMKQNQVPMAVGTASGSKRCLRILELLQLKQFFPVIATIDDAPLPHGKKKIFETAAEKLHVKPENCVVIDDSAYGIDAAKAAGMKTIGFASHNQAREELQESDHVISNFRELNYEKVARLVQPPHKTR